MAPLVLEGASLGQRHRHYNRLLKDATTTGQVEPAAIDYNKTDIENLFNIDIASNNRDVEYILNVLKGEDLLYVSRAIKRSNWLFTDAHYAHIIEPGYLHSELFPQMMPKASCKLLLHIRLTVKDESQVEKFYRYFKDNDPKTAFKWLPNCPISVIEEAVEKNDIKIPPVIFGRLCKRSPKVFEIFVEATKYQYTSEHLEAAMFLLDKHLELYLNAIEQKENYKFPGFNKKYTELIMKKCPERIINKFNKYIYSIDEKIFPKYLKQEDIKSFITKQLENDDIKHWFDEDRIMNFIKYLPNDEKYELMKLCIDKTDKINDEWGPIRCAISSGCGGGNSKTYRFYKNLPFYIAFPELKKMIRTESNPDERNAMLMILIGTTQKNLTHIHTLLKYYRERHINEPFRFKIQFVNELLQKTDPHLFNDSIWTILDELFRSMEVYIESENNVQTCIKAIIAYKVTHDEPVPAIIENKFQFDTLRPYQRKLKGTHKGKLFNYLFDSRLNKLKNHTISNETELNECAELLKQAFNLLKDWDKELVDYPTLINKIKDCVTIRKENGWSTWSLLDLYLMKKSWKKTMFEESLILSPSEKTIMNALKHDPELLRSNINEVDAVACNEVIRLDKVLGKLRVYWPETLATEWISECHVRLNMPGIPAQHKARIRGLFCLLNQHQLLEFVKLHEPQETKIDWVNDDERLLSWRKIIAQNMHIARPQVTPDAILSYAKGDYVQFTQPALNSILYNLRATESQGCIQNLLNGTVSLQKHGIHLAFMKLSTADMKKLLGDVWESTKNLSIRSVLFQSIHKLICKEQDETMIAELWRLTLTFIDSLTAEENRNIYVTLGNVGKVHKSVKPAFCIKGYKFLKSLPPKVDCRKILSKIKEEVINIIDELDSDFIGNIIQEFVDEVILKKRYGWGNRHNLKILALYFLSANNESTLKERFEKVFVPLMDNCLSLWDKIDDNNFVIRENFMEIIEALHRYPEYSFLKNKVNPSSLYRNILHKLESALPITENIVLFMRLSLAAALADIYVKHSIPDPSSSEEESQLNELYTSCIGEVGDIIIQFLKENIETYGSFILEPIAEAQEKLFMDFNINSTTRIKYLEYMCSKDNSVPVYLLVINLLSTYFNDGEKELMKKIRLMLQSHPSSIVHIHYFMKFGTFPMPNDEQ